MSGMILVRKSVVVSLWAVFFLSFVMVVGCHPGPKQGVTIPPNTLDVSENADKLRSSEVELVEQMAHYRSLYEQQLEKLEEFYNQQGNHLKASWASQELEHLRLGPQHSYLVVAELAGPDLKATTSIIAADQLYDEGMRLFREAKGSLPGMFANKKKLYQAIDKFNELITQYPTSDKIDDAAYQVAEIYNHYLKDYYKALLYYQRVWQWDPQTPKAPRYAVARIYDDHLHDRAKALEYYQKAINLETAYPEKVEYAKNRIEMITSELSKQ